MRIARIAERQADLEELLMGPPAAAAFKPDGEATPAAAGFARKHGVDAQSLERVETAKGVYLAFRRSVRGKPAVDVLPAVLAGVLRDLTFPRQMHWDAQLDDGRGELLFGRPIRWILFLLRRARRAVCHRPARVRPERRRSGRAIGRGHLRPSLSGHERPCRTGHQGAELRRVSREAPRELRDARTRGAPREDRPGARRARAPPRRARQRSGGQSVAPAAGSSRPGRVSRRGRRHVRGRVPRAPRGRAHDDDDPPPALLPGGGRPRPAAAGVPGRGQHRAGRSGGSSRATSSACLWRACATRDSSGTPIAARRSRRACLGSTRCSSTSASGATAPRRARIEALAGWVASDVLGAPDAAPRARQAARLAKADLATDMVRELTELQGTMGGIYAREEGLPEAVWKAIYHHYLPLGIEPAAPPSRADLGAAAVTWAAVSIADKLDTVVGLFAAGERPTGTRDPFGLRRQAQGMLRTMVDLPELAGLDVPVPLDRMLAAGAGRVSVTWPEPRRRPGALARRRDGLPARPAALPVRAARLRVRRTERRARARRGPSGPARHPPPPRGAAGRARVGRLRGAGRGVQARQEPLARDCRARRSMPSTC